MPTQSSQLPTDTSRTPVVVFEYPDSTTEHMKTRYVRVTQADSDFIKGYELENAHSAKKGNFKQYSRNRIAMNGVALVSF